MPLGDLERYTDHDYKGLRSFSLEWDDTVSGVFRQPLLMRLAGLSVPHSSCYRGCTKIHPEFWSSLKARTQLEPLVL